MNPASSSDSFTRKEKSIRRHRKYLQAKRNQWAGHHNDIQYVEAFSAQRASVHDKAIDNQLLRWERKMML